MFKNFNKKTELNTIQSNFREFVKLYCEDTEDTEPSEKIRKYDSESGEELLCKDIEKLKITLMSECSKNDNGNVKNPFCNFVIMFNNLRHNFEKEFSELFNVHVTFTFECKGEYIDKLHEFGILAYGSEFEEKLISNGNFKYIFNVLLQKRYNELIKKNVLLNDCSCTVKFTNLPKYLILLITKFSRKKQEYDKDGKFIVENPNPDDIKILVVTDSYGEETIYTIRGITYSIEFEDDIAGHAVSCINTENTWYLFSDCFIYKLNASNISEVRLIVAQTIEEDYEVKIKNIIPMILIYSKKVIYIL
jgi:hypothetical protein